MSFLDGIRNTAKLTLDLLLGKYDGEQPVAAKTTASEAQAPKPPQQSEAYLSSPISVVNPTGKPIGKVGEQLIISGKEYVTGGKVAKSLSPIGLTNIASEYLENRKLRKAEVDRRIAQIMQKCIANGITTKEEFEQKIIGKKFYENIFNKLVPIHIRAKMLDQIEKDLDAYIEFRKKHKINKNVDETQAFTEYRKITSDGENNGVDMYNDKEIGDVIKELGGEKFLKLSDEQKVKAILEMDKMWRARSNEKLQKRLAECSTEEEKQKVREEEANKVRYYEQRRHWALAVTTNGNVAILNTQNLDARDMDRGFGMVLNVQKTQKAKTETANSVKFEKFTNIVSAYHERGEYPPQDTLQSATGSLVREMGCAYAQQFESSFFNYRQGVQNGTIQNPVLTNEELTATSTGIGVGIASNVTMSSIEKADLLTTWDNHARKFDDYKTVKSEFKKAVDKYIQEHPEMKDKIEEVIKKVEENIAKKEKEEKASNENKPVDGKDANKAHSTGTKSQIVTAGNESAISSNEGVPESSVQKSMKAEQTELTVTVKPTDDEVEADLRKLTYDETKNKYRDVLSDKDLAKVIVSKNLKQHIPQLKNTLRTMNIAEKIDLINKACPEMQIAVIRNSSATEGPKIAEFANLDFDTRKMSRTIIKEKQHTTKEGISYDVA